MRQALLVLTTAILIVALATPAQPLHCNGDITTVTVGNDTFYIDDRSDAAGEIDHWVYEEWNDQEGLQSGSPVYVIEPPLCSLGINVCYDPCTHKVPDRLIL